MQAIQAARAAQAARAVPEGWTAGLAWSIAGSTAGVDRYRAARSPFDARRTQAWQSIDATLAELRAS